MTVCSIPAPVTRFARPIPSATPLHVARGGPGATGHALVVLEQASRMDVEIDPADLPESFKQPRGWVGLAKLDVRQIDVGDPECVRHCELGHLQLFAEKPYRLAE